MNDLNCCCDINKWLLKMEDKNNYFYLFILLNIMVVFSYCKYVV